MEVNIRIAMIMIDTVLKITITITISIIMWFAFVTDSTMKSKKGKRTKYEMVDDDDFHHDYVLGE